MTGSSNDTDDGNDAAAEDPAVDESEAAARNRPPLRRHLIVLAIGAVGLIVGIVLVLTGRSSDTPTSPATSTKPAIAGAPLPDLGSVDDEAAARTLIGDLDPTTLRSSEEPVTTRAQETGSSSTVSSVDVSESGLQRCQQAIVQQNTDRSLGPRRAAAHLVVGSTPTFVVSYPLPATGEAPAGDRIVVVDARTCRVLTAVEP